MAASKITKKDLESKIGELEAKLANLSKQLDTAPKTQKAKASQTKPTKQKGSLPKGFEALKAEPKAQPKPTKQKGSLPKGFEASKAKPAEPKAQPKPTEPKKQKGSLPKGFEPPKTEAPPAKTESGSLEDAYQNASMTDFHQYRAKVTGYTPASNRYFVRRTAPVGKVPTTSWHIQKAVVTGYTQPSNQYFATRSRLAYHPPEKMFTGYGISFGSGSGQVQVAPEPKKTRGTLPKGF